MPKLRLAFAGTPDFAARHLDALLASDHTIVAALTQPDRRAGRGKKATASAVKERALAAGVPVMQPPTLRDPEAVAEIAALELDALVVVAYGLILPQNVLDLPRYGCLNVHGSLLPRWRGAAPIQRAIEAGDVRSGVTIMQMDAGLDTGPMLAHVACDIAPMTTSGDLYDQLAKLGPAGLIAVLDDLPAHLDSAEAQNDSEATHAAKITKQEAQIDWTESAATIARRIRAFNPAPGCFTFMDSDRLKLWQASPTPISSNNTANAAPGTIVRSDDQGICVRCGDGALIIESLQIPGAKALPTSEVLRGHGQRFAVGTLLGQAPE